MFTGFVGTHAPQHIVCRNLQGSKLKRVCFLPVINGHFLKLITSGKASSTRAKHY